MKSLYSIWRVNVTALLVALIIGGAASKSLAVCGDSNADGVLDIRDLVTDIEFLFNGGALPVSLEAADFDGHTLLTIGDVQEKLNCAFLCDIPPFGTCPPNLPPLAPVIDTGVKLHFPNRIPVGVTSFDIPLTLISSPRYSALSAPMSITLDGAPAIVDSITFPAPGSVFESAIGLSYIDAPGVVRLGMVSVSSELSTRDRLAIIHLSVTPSPTEGALDIRWVTLSPVQLPAPDSSVYPLFYRFLGDDGFVPTLSGNCCIVAGDANDDGSYNIADITFLVARVFTGGASPPCAQSADANGDGETNIADVTYGIARIFSNGPEPICGP